MRRNRKPSLFADMIVICLFVACIFGWFANVFKAANHVLIEPKQITPVFIVRIVGMLIPPVGIVAGYL
jgi:hypothetical protein